MYPNMCFAMFLFDSSDTTSAYPAIWVALFFLIILPMLTRQRDEAVTVKAIYRRRNKKERENMNELASGFIEKDCVIYLFNGNQYIGIIKKVTESAILIDKDGTNEIINLDFVARIREYPKKKNGKKKSVVLD